MKALLFGSIGVIVDSSQLQLDGYNRAFEEAGLNWHWEREDYERLLLRPGGKQRLRDQARARGDEAVDEAMIDRLHARKSELFQQGLREASLSPRPGVTRLIKQCTAAGIKLGLVTSTELDNVRATLGAAGDAVELAHFDVVTHRGVVAKEKPDPAAWHHALDRLALTAGDAVAIEDTASCVQSAVDAGLFTLATPNSFAGGQDFRAAHAIVDCLGDQRRAARQLAGRQVVADELVTIDRLRERHAQAA